MSEDAVTSEDSGGGNAPDTSGLAIDLAMEEARSDPGLREDVAAFLRDQRSLIAIQKHHLHTQFKQLLLGIWEKRLGVLLRVATAFMGLAVAAGLGFMVWQAAQSNGLSIQPLSVPPDLASRGITGEVVAGRLLDQLNRMQAATISRRASRTYASDWSQQGIKLEIPETGVSLSELDHFLRDRLGHDVQVSGDVIANPTGITLTVRVDNAGDASFSGPETALPDLVQQAAEAIYRLTQPYRYSVYIRPFRPDESLALARSMAQSGLPEDRPWAYNIWALQIQVREGVDPALALFEKGVALQPGNPLLRANIGSTRLIMGQWEASLEQTRQAIPLANNNQKLFRPSSVEPMRLSYVSRRDRLLGDFRQAVIAATQVIESGDPGQVSPLGDLAVVQLGSHEWGAARETFVHPPMAIANAFYRELNEFSIALAQVQIAGTAENWTAVLAGEAAVETLARQSPGLRTQLPTTLAPLLALAKAHLGRMAEAGRDIAPTPGDCDPCLIARGQLAALQGQHGRADFWFARAVANAPSIPFAATAWGQALLARGDIEGAIAKFALANKKGPKFADPLEGWGEALMAKNQSHLALAKFAQAEKFAPNWGRLQLKWGEALAYAGKKNEAVKHFARAAQLDLTPEEKSELQKVPHG